MADIIETAINAGAFKTLITAIQTAGLTDTLKSGSFTVFAPTDDAFGKLPAGTIDALLKDISELKKILTYHVVASKMMAADIAEVNAIATVQGAKLRVDCSEGNMKINHAKVITPNLEADNGVIHAIDAVLLPE